MNNITPNENDILRNRNAYIQNAMERLAQMAVIRREQSLEKIRNILTQQPQILQESLALITSPDHVSVISPLHNSTRTLFSTLSLVITQGYSTNLPTTLEQRQNIPFIDLLQSIDFELLPRDCYDQVHPYFNESLHPEMSPENMAQVSPFHDALFQFVDTAYTFLKIKYA